MDFHKAFADAIEKYSTLEGLIFCDPEGEAVLYDGTLDDPFELQLAGAKMPIIMAHLPGFDKGRPLSIELGFEKRYIVSVRLADNYTITAIHHDGVRRVRLREYLLQLAEAFNREIV